MITLDHVPQEERKLGEPYISLDLHRDVAFIDCDIHQLSFGSVSFIWSIGFDRTTKAVAFHDSKMRQIKLEEFIEIVTTQTPQYLTALLFLLPDPVGYFKDLK